MAVGAALWDDLLEGEELAYLETIPPIGSRPAALPDELHPELLAALPFHQLYDHQRQAWDAAARGEHLILATGTASGKSLAFNLPVLDALARQPTDRALYLYPAKALAQDQARALRELDAPNVRAAIYDGDTPAERRWQIRKWANVILTNPDMLHVGVLPHHDRWADVSATCCVACGGWRRSTAPSRSSSSHRRRSPTPGSSRRDSQASSRRSSTVTPRPGPSARSCSGIRSCSTRSSGSARVRWATPRG